MSQTCLQLAQFFLGCIGPVEGQNLLKQVDDGVQGAILVVSAIFVFANLLVDMLYSVIDPRIRVDS